LSSTPTSALDQVVEPLVAATAPELVAQVGVGVTMVGATNAPVLTTAAFRMKSRRPLVPPVSGRPASSVKLAMGPAS
jgi:hypothetical protein